MTTVTEALAAMDTVLAGALAVLAVLGLLGLVRWMLAAASWLFGKAQKHPLLGILALWLFCGSNNRNDDY